MRCAFLSLLLACGSAQGPASQPESPATGAPSDPLRALNASARASATIDTLHGTPVPDPYRLLEDDSPATQSWIEAQNARTLAAIEPYIDPTASRRLTALLSIATIADARIAADRVFFTQRADGREQAALYVVAGDAPARLLVDPLTFGERAALDWFFPSPRGRYVAFGISIAGDERSTLHLVAVDSGAAEPDLIPHTKWSSVAWLNSERGFYYTRYPKAGEPNHDPENEDTYFPGVFFHALGSSPDADVLLHRSNTGTDFPVPDTSDDDHWLVVNVFRGWSASDVLLFRDPTRGAAPSDPVTVIAGDESVTSGHVQGDSLYLFTNKNAPKGRIVRVALQKAADLAEWRDVVPEQSSAILDTTFVGHRVAIHTLDNVRSRLRIFSLNGREEREVELPMHGAVESISGQASGDSIAFVFSSLLQPPTLFRYGTRGKRLTAAQSVTTDLDLSGFEMVRDEVTSADGTRIPVTLVQRRGAPRDANQPVLLYGYGGFSVSLLPSFARNALYWIERGGIYAVANLRGGAEFGEEWHRAGNLENKTRVFEDFEAVIRWLSTSAISRPGRIAITGGSNGGLLMGAMITRVPDAFAATATYVGLYDMVRYHRFPPAELWISEYGSSEVAEQFRNLLGYSPYHRVTAGTPYPAVLVETADHDSRVHWGHSTKFAAALQEATASEHPIYFFMVRQVGHGAGTRLSDQVDRYVRAYTFFERELGMRTQ